MAAKPKKVLYIGQDNHFWRNLTSRFSSTYDKIEFNFIDFPYFSEELLNTKLLEILDLKPDFIYLDVSENSNELLKLGLFIKRISVFSETPLTALLEATEDIDNALLLGFDFAFVKGSELHDTIYHPYFFRFPKEAISKNFAIGKLKEQEGLIRESVRIGFFAYDYMKIECDAKFKVGDVIALDTALPKDLVQSNVFTIREVFKSDLFYKYKFGYNVEYKFLTDLVHDEEKMNDVMQISDERIRAQSLDRLNKERAQAQAEHDAWLEKAKKKFKAWIDDNKDTKVSKKTKILVVDEELSFLKSEKRKLDSFPYIVRIQTSFSDNFEQIDHYLPQLIAFQIPVIDFESDGVALSDEEKIRLKTKQETQLTDFFSALVHKVVSINNYSPFIIITNCTSLSSKAFQDTFRYELIIANKDLLKLDLILKMANIYEKKQEESLDQSIKKKILSLRKKDPTKYGRLTKSDFSESNYYVNKNHKLSKAYYHKTVEVKQVSESNVHILVENEEELQLGNYLLETPFRMVLNFIKVEGQKCSQEEGKFLFKGLIHGIGEKEKKELRMYINEIHTAHKVEQRKKEEDDFKNLNTKVLDESLEKEKAKAKTEGSEGVEESQES